MIPITKPIKEKNYLIISMRKMGETREKKNKFTDSPVYQSDND